MSLLVLPTKALVTQYWFCPIPCAFPLLSAPWRENREHCAAAEQQHPSNVLLLCSLLRFPILKILPRTSNAGREVSLKTEWRRNGSSWQELGLI